MTIQKHKHHIVPKHHGGTDHPDNLIELTVEEHIQAHLDLYEKFGRYQDFCAAKMLEGCKDPNFRQHALKCALLAQKMKAEELGLPSTWYLKDSETRERVLSNLLLVSPEGGKVQGIKNRDSGHMRKISLAVSPEERQKHGAMGGTATIKSGRGAFADPEERAKVAVLGGKVQGKRNAESGHLKRISQETSRKIKSGEIVLEKRYWCTNGIINKRLPISVPMPEGFWNGKIQK